VSNLVSAAWSTDLTTIDSGSPLPIIRMTSTFVSGACATAGLREADEVGAGACPSSPADAGPHRIHEAAMINVAGVNIMIPGPWPLSRGRRQNSSE
jgi:hypothetical protein